MKLSEVKQPVNEALSSWIGDLPAAALKGFFSGKGTKQQMIQDLFIKDFTEDAFVSLMNAVPQIVDPKIDSSKTKLPKKTKAKGQGPGPKPTPGVNAGAPPAPPAAPTGSQVTPESYFNKLDAIFESIVNEAKGAAKQSINSYITDWFNLYMSGVDWTANPNNAANVKQAIQNIENVYRASKGSKGKVKQAIQQLATISFALAKSSPKIPAGMKDELQRLKSQAAGAGASNSGAPNTGSGTGPAKPGAPNAPSTPPANSAPTANTPTLASIQADMQTLAQSDPTAYAKLIQSMLKSVGASPKSP